MSLLGSLIRGARPAPIPEGIGRQVLLLNGKGFFYETSSIDMRTCETRPARIVAALKDGNVLMKDIAEEAGIELEDARKAILRMCNEGRVVRATRRGIPNKFYLPENAPESANEPEVEQ